MGSCVSSVECWFFNTRVVIFNVNSCSLDVKTGQSNDMRTTVQVKIQFLQIRYKWV